MVQGYYTIQEAAHYLGISTDELKQMAQKGQIRSFQDRGTLRFRIQDIQELARQRDATSDPEMALSDPVPPPPKSSVPPAPSSGKRKSQTPRTPTKKEDVPDVFDFEFDNENVDLGGDFLGPQSNPKSKSSASPKGGKKSSSSPIPHAGSDSDVRLVSDGSDVSFSIGKDSDIKLADSQVKLPHDPSKPKSTAQTSSGSKKSSQLALGSGVQPPSKQGKTGKSGKTGMSPKPSKARPVGGVPPVDSGVRLVPMDSDSDVKILGASDEVPLGEHLPAHTDSNVRLDRVPLPPADSSEGNMMQTEEINLDEEIRKLEESDKAQSGTKMKVKSQLKFPTSSPFELSDSEMKMPSELMEGPKTPVKQTSDESDSEFDLSLQTEDESSDFDLAAQPPEEGSSDFDLAAQPPEDGSSDFDLLPSGGASDSDFSLEIPPDEQEQVMQGDYQAGDLSSGSGISLSNPVDAGISLEAQAEGSDFDLSLDADGDAGPLADSDGDFQLQVGDTPSPAESQPAVDESDSEFELSLDSDSDPDAPTQSDDQQEDIDFSLEADAGQEAGESVGDSSEFELNVSGEDELGSKLDSDSEFELTLDDSGNIAAMEVEEEAPQVKSKPKPKKGKSKAAAPAADVEEDIFETDFEVPALDESDENTIADSELESSDFDLDLDDSELAGEEESGSQVVALDEEESVVDSDDGDAVVDDLEVEEESSDFGDLDEDVAADEETESEADEEEETESKGKTKTETVIKPKLVPAAPWGVVPVVFMLPCVVVMFLVGILGFELMQSSAGLRPPGLLTVAVADLIGQPIAMKK